MATHRGGDGRRAPSHTIDTNILAVLALLGHTITNDKNVDYCPVCKAEGGCRIYGHRVHCFHAGCEIKANATDLIAYHLDLVSFREDGWAEPLTKEGFAAVEAFRAEHALESVPVVEAPRVDPAALRSPFASDVTRVWTEASPINLDLPSARFVKQRGIDINTVVELGLARAVPSAMKEVPWGSYWPKGHRLLLPVFDARGVLVALRTRWVHPREAKPSKSVSPKGWGSGALRGTCYANPTAIKLLNGELTEPLMVVVVEGDMDFVTWATTRPDLAVLGLWNGSWSKDIADRIPDGSTVVVRTHHDKDGKKYASKVASTFGDRVKLLRSPAPPDAKTDDNDLLMAGKLPKDPTEGAKPMEVPARQVKLPGLEVRESGKPLNSRKNAIILLEHHPRWKGRLWFDCFRVCYWLGDKVVDDATINRLMVETGDVLGVQFSKQTTEEAMVYVARQNVRHPLAEMLQSLVWDGTSRLDELLPRYFGAADTSLNRRIGAWWMLQAVARPLEPGCQADYTLVLIGKQGIRKSTAARRLAMRSEWFHDTKIKMGEKDALQALQGCWIMELAELSSLRGADVETIKAFLTALEDKFRPPYAKGLEAFKRSTVFLGTTNNRQFLKDPTGNRRFWPVDVGPDPIDTEALERDREQLWAEAVHRWRSGGQRYPTEAEERELDLQRRGFEFEDPWVPLLRRWLKDRKDGFTIDRVMMGALQLHERDLGRYSNKVGALLRGLGYERVRIRKKGKRGYVWVKVDKD